MHGMYPENTLQEIVTNKNTRKVWEHWLDYLDDDMKYSPDAFKVQQYLTQKVFLPDCFKKNNAGNISIREFGKLLAPVYTEEQYTFWEKKLPWGPWIPLEVEDKKEYKGVGSSPAQIMGELWEVPPAYIFNLDRFYKNGVEFVRKRVDLILRTRTIHSPTVVNNKVKVDPTTGKYYYDHGVPNVSDWQYDTVRAWMYVGKKNFWEPLLDAGFLFQPVKQFTPKSDELKSRIPKYYFYSERINE